MVSQKSRSLALVAAAAVLFAVPAGATTYTWDSTVTSGNWTDSHWALTDAAEGATAYPSTSEDVVVFPDNVSLCSIMIASAVTPASISVDGGTYRFEGAAMAPSGEISINAGTVALAGAVSSAAIHNVAAGATLVLTASFTSPTTYKNSFKGSGTLIVDGTTFRMDSTGAYAGAIGAFTGTFIARNGASITTTKNNNQSNVLGQGLFRFGGVTVTFGAGNNNYGNSAFEVVAGTDNTLASASGPSLSLSKLTVVHDDAISLDTTQEYVLITSAGGLFSGLTSDVSLDATLAAANWAVKLNDAGTELILYQVGSQLTWRGASGSSWSGSTSWVNASDEMTAFATNDDVVFDDTGFGASDSLIEVVVDADVEPASVAVDVAAGHSYAFSGSSKVTGGAVVTQTGAGALKLMSDVFAGHEIDSNGTGTLEIVGDVSLSKIGAPSGTFDYGRSLVVDDGATLTLTENHNLDNLSVTNNGSIVFAGTENYSEFRSYFSGAGTVVVTNRATLRYGYYSNAGFETPAYATEFTGDTYVYAGSEITFFSRNRNYGAKPFYGSGSIHLAGGSLTFPSNNGNSIYLGSLVAESDTTSLIDCRYAGGKVPYTMGTSTLTGSGTVNVDLDTVGIRMYQDSSAFTGTMNLWGVKAMSDAAGFMHSRAGSAQGTFNLMVKPGNISAYTGFLDVKPTTWLYMEMETGTPTLNLGAFSIAHTNMAVYCKNPFTLALGGNGGDSDLEGAFALQNAGTYAITKSGAGKLTLGEGFQMTCATTLGVTETDYTANAYAKSVTVNAGTFAVQQRDLADVAVTISTGVTVDLDASMGLTETNPADTTVKYTLFKTTGDIAFNSKQVVVSASTSKQGKWRLGVSTEEENSTTYNVLKAYFAPTGLVVVVK